MLQRLSGKRTTAEILWEVDNLDETNKIILKIGDVDMSEHVICEAVDINRSPVWSDSFTAVNGEEKKKCLGVRIALSADFSVLDGTAAAALVSACNADSVSVTYKCPAPETAVFDRPSLRCVPVFNDGEVDYWNISVSMTCPLKGSGL